MSVNIVDEVEFSDGSGGVDDCQFSDSAWNHRTNCESGDNEEYRLNSVPLADEYQGNIDLNSLVLDNGKAEVPTMGGAVSYFEKYIEESEDTVVVLESDESEQKYIDQLHRFNKAYMRKQYARVKQAERHYKGRYGSNFSVSMITLTASNTDPNGEFVAYLDHLEDLKNGYRRARNRLNKVLDDREEWDYVAIVEPHKSGYAHIHLGVFYTGRDLKTQDFKPVVESHIRNCERASEAAHKVLDQDEYEHLKVVNEVSRDGNKRDLGCVSVESDDNNKAGMGSYVGAYLAKELNRDNGVLEADEYLKRFYAGMWASGSQRFMTSQGLKDKTQQLRLEEADYEELSYRDAVDKLAVCEYGVDVVDWDSLGDRYMDIVGMIKGSETLTSDLKNRLLESVRAKFRGSWELVGVAFKSELDYEWEGQDQEIERDDIHLCDSDGGGGGGSMSLDESWQSWDVC